MKHLILAFVILSLAHNVLASVGRPNSETKSQVYTFKFKLKGETLEIRNPASTYEEAYERAATSCFDHFRKAQGGHVSEDQGLDIIDVCANPRS